MEIRIQVKGLPGASRLRRFAASRIEAPLARFADAITEATVQLGDINGPERGGVDKLCRVVLRLKNSAVMVIEELGADITQAIERVAERLQRNVARQLCLLADPAIAATPTG